MKLDLKKNLAAKALKVGKSRICFNNESLADIKEAITKQDILDLYKSGAIRIKLPKGRKKIEKRKTKRKAGKIKMKVRNRKQEYVQITRRLRTYIHELRNQDKITPELYKEIRKKIKAKAFRNKAQLKEFIGK